MKILHSAHTQKISKGPVPLERFQSRQRVRKEIGARNQHTSLMGFTLVETLVAITVLLMVIIGPMSIASRGIQNSFYAGDQTTAIYLAQEAIEHIQRLRDDTALANFQDFKTNGNNGDGDTWLWYTALDSHCKDADGCDINFANSPIAYRDCTTPSNCQMRKYIGTGAVDRVYGYSVGTDWVPSMYTRRVRVGAFSNGGVPVTVTVSWNSTLFGSTRSVILQTYLYDKYTRFE
jgi:Tfp pilus assembly protein PilV